MISYLTFASLLTRGIYAANSSFSMEEATKFARLSQIAYCDESVVVHNWNCEACHESKVHVVPGSLKIINGDYFSATQMLVGRMSDKPVCFVSVRGSHNVPNWIRDFQIWTDPVPYSTKHCQGCKVHSGFLTIWNKMEPLLMHTLSGLGCKANSSDDTEIYMTGHSLGAAVATLGAFALHEKGYKIGRIYSFESPRVGNPKFSFAYKSVFGSDIQNFRITHHKDPIVHMPMQGYWWYRANYRHVDTEVFFSNATGSAHKVCKDNEDKSCSDQYLIHLEDSWEHCANDAFGQNFSFCAAATSPCYAPNASGVVEDRMFVV
jgi:hypothetical protein